MSGPSETLSVAFTTLGCKVNRAESERIAAQLLGRGVAVSDPDAAEIIIVDTCTVTGEADAKARKAVRRALGRPRQPLVVVTGCLAALDSQGLAQLGERVVVEADKTRVAERVVAALGVSGDAPGRGGSSHTPTRVGEAFRTRATVKIQDGCDCFCTYCIVPYARGVPRSVAFETVLREAEALVAAGVAEIVLSGINLGRYESDGRDLADLVRALDALGVARLRLSSIEPPDLSERLVGALGEATSTCAHLHVPLQSGSDAVLSTMGRAYGIAEFERWVERAREAIPGLALTTDVIAGFPGETDEDAERTAQACERIGFSKLHVFRYSAREGTPAASMPQVPAPVRAERAERLRELSDRLRREWLAGLVGGDVEVLVERTEAQGARKDSRASGPDGPFAEGVTREYARVRIPLGSESAMHGPQVGEVLHARVACVAEDGVLLGRL